jgi:tungstate transport system ATP-binding protein
MNKISRPVRLEYTNIVKTYGKGKNTKAILNDISLSLKGGECTLITGKNACGKSTQLRIMGGLLKPDSGLINTGLHNLNWNKYRKALGNDVMYFYQEPYMFDGTVRQNLTYALDKKQNKDIIDNALKWAELEHRCDTQAKCLSGGERQRVALAQAWIKQPAVLLLDEPTANMDTEHRLRTETFLSTFIDSGTALYIASHDPNHFHRIMNHRLLIEDGYVSEFEETKSTDTVNDQNDDTLFNDSLLQSNKNVTLFPNNKSTNFSSQDNK